MALETVGLVSGVIGIVSFLEDLIPDPDKQQGATVSIKAGRIKDSPGMEGKIAAVYAWDADNLYLGKGGGTDIEVGDYKEIVVEQDSPGAQAEYAGIAIGDNAVCVAWVTVKQYDMTEGGAWSGDIAYHCDQHWYENNQVAGKVKDTGEEYIPKCTWFDADHTGDTPSAAMKFNIKAYGEKVQDTYENGASCDMTAFGEDKGPINDPLDKRASRPQLDWMKEKLVVSNITTHHAENLCKSVKLRGPDFVGTDGNFCDMETKTLTPLCSTKNVDGCLDIDQDTITVNKRSTVARRQLQTTHKAYKSIENW